MRLPRPLYIALRFAEALGSAGSRLFNAAILGGSTHQSTSARAVRVVHVHSAAQKPFSTAAAWAGSACLHGGTGMWMIWHAYEAWVRLCDGLWAVGRAKTDDRRGE